jgi:hypothetical protein
MWTLPNWHYAGVVLICPAGIRINLALYRQVATHYKVSLKKGDKSKDVLYALANYFFPDELQETIESIVMALMEGSKVRRQVPGPDLDSTDLLDEERDCFRYFQLLFVYLFPAIRNLCIINLPQSPFIQKESNWTFISRCNNYW